MAAFLIFLLILSSLPLLYSTPADDLSVLLKLKASVAAPDSSVLPDWDPAVSPPEHCSFSGVTCDGDARVINLNVSFLPRHPCATLPPELGHLDRLVNLTLSANNISGELPASLANLKSLRLLNISNNNFTGAFPREIAAGLLSLEVLDVYNNNFSGPLPAVMSALPKLRYVHLGGNFFNGPIPESFADIAGLEYLGLNGNGLSGTIPASLGKLSNLKEMYLGYYNKYEGGIPPELGMMASLTRLDLGNCGLTGAIPATLGRLKLLDTLFLQLNNLTGSIPMELGRLIGIKSLDLSVNELTGEIPESFGNLKQLLLLNLFSNHLRGQIPPFIADLPNLEVLQLWSNNFTFELPEKLGQNGKLKILDVTSNRLTGTIPAGLCAGGMLTVLVLMKNAFFGLIPLELGRCRSLVHVRLSNNFLNGSIPSGLLDLPEADMIELSDNYFSGDLPEVIRGAKLEMLMLGNNLISGSIPPAIGNLPALQTLSLELNRLTGEIPAEIGELKKLSKLNLSGNSLTGAIPTELSRCSSLLAIDLSSNKLTGEIPVEVVQLDILNTLNLSRNQLTGEIPMTMQQMQSLTTLDLSYNSLSGQVPLEGQFLVFNASTFDGNTGLCGRPLQARLTCARSTGGATSRLSAKKALLAVGTLVLGVLVLLAVVKWWKAAHGGRLSGAWKLTVFQRVGFSVEDVVECLKEDNIIGKGGAGIVYRGCVKGGEVEVAIKRLVGRGAGGEQDRGFSAEVATLGKIRHRNIVRLMGYVASRDCNLLLYEYMQNGSLGDMLHGSKGAHLGWDARRRIAAEAARGLCYLHHDCSPRIIHRDIKSNNILLDSNFEAHVADFGLARFLAGAEASECMSSIAGSYGYIAPEYAYTLRVDEKSDVYSFGVVLLELITGKRPVGSFGEDIDIVHWVRKTTSQLVEKSDTAAVLEVVDRRLAARPLDKITNLYRVAMMCVEERSAARPTMREVVHVLNSPTSCPHPEILTG